MVDDFMAKLSDAFDSYRITLADYASDHHAGFDAMWGRGSWQKCLNDLLIIGDAESITAFLIVVKFRLMPAR